ncbi:MAG: hypothetical protein ABIA67_01895 [Candidatus Margulisiibacteriota bacterium]
MKKKLLIQWASRTFIEIFGALIPKLAEKFDIVVLLSDYSTPAGMIGQLNSWKEQGMIKRYSMFSHHEDLNFHLSMKKEIKELRPFNFDVWLTSAEMQVFERYVWECVLPKHCVSIVLWHNITYLFMYNEDLARNLLAGTEISKTLFPREKRPSGYDLYARGWVEKIKEAGNLSNLRRKVITLLWHKIRWVFLMPRKKLRTHFRRIVLPWVLTGNAFRLGRHDRLTQLGSGRSDAIVFCDEVEAEAHKVLFKTPHIYVAQYPTYGSCRCNGNKGRDAAVLSPLSGFDGRDQISEKNLSLFYRDFQSVLSQTGAKSIHLRPHPDEKKAWPEQLKKYLMDRGLDVVMVENKHSMRDVCCDYLAVAGFASAALRDARASCDHASVIGFVGISKAHFANPRFVFGKSEGISWIEEDGSYNPDIFTKRKYDPPKRKNIIEILDHVERLKMKRELNVI